MKKLDEKVLAHGEVTGHAHRVSVDVYEDKDKTKYFAGPTRVVHEEHKPIEIPDGRWASGQILRYDYFEELDKIVID